MFMAKYPKEDEESKVAVEGQRTDDELLKPMLPASPKPHKKVDSKDGQNESDRPNHSRKG